jgi:carboxyl-terminal processing protease
MKNKNKLFVAAAAVVLFSGFITKDSDIYFEINKSIDIFGRVYKEVTLNYVDEINPEEFMLAGIGGMLDSLDPYTNFIDGNQQKDIDIITKGKYGGIGATVGLRDEDITIVDLIEGYSAQRQGIRIGDVINQINDVKVSKENYDTLSDLLKGDPGTTVKLVINREGTAEPLTFNLVREEIEVKNLSYYGFYPETSNNAYLKLSGFSRTAGDEVKRALLDLKSKKEIKSIMLDLRGNPGGLLDAAIDVAEKFLKKGQLIVSVKGRDSANVKNYYSEEEPIAGNIKLAVLIDDGSASASEIVTGALQDHDRAVVLGINSFGKGLVQTVIPLSYDTSLKITTAKYYTPSGRCIQKINYSEKNKVFDHGTKIPKQEFLTDNKRTVMSAGGIMPDSTVTNESKSFLVQRLFATGMFFEFATHYFNGNNDVINLSDDKLISEFKNFLSGKKFEFVSPAEKLIEQLKKAAEVENLDKSLIEYLNKEESRIDATHSNEFDKYKEDIIVAIREELASRSGGRAGRIITSLKYDKQFATTLSLLNNQKEYDKILRDHVN